MASMTGSDLDVLVVERESWENGPPHELFKRLRGECPVHWSHCVPEYEDEAGYWSLTKADDIHAVSRDWETYSSERDGITMSRSACSTASRSGRRATSSRTSHNPSCHA
jgi:cytochrome P450